MKALAVPVALLLISSRLFSQTDESSELFQVLMARDSLLFNLGFNTCDISQFERLLSDQFEFYHDEAGVMASKAVFISSIEDGICNLPYKPRRELDKSSSQIFPLRKGGILYGAIQMGTHRFYAIEKNASEHLTAVARFTHVWLLENGEWKLSRGLSYDHHEPEKKIDEQLLFKDRHETERWLLAQHVPALGIGYISGGKIQEVKVYGELEKGRPAPDNTIFNVASLTKPVTALVALKLVNEGKWSLDEPIYNYWTDPDIAGDRRARELTTRHILSHQSGFPNWRRENPDGKLAFQFDPGTRFQYSGEGFEYLRKALEQKFHTPLGQLADELLFKPLGMNDTRFYWDETVDEGRFAKWHNAEGEAYDTYKNRTANGADDLLTTVGDYSKFVAFIINGAGLSGDLYQQMISDQARVKHNKYFGLGWWVDENVRGRENAVVHGGDDTGVRTMAFILPESQQGLVIFTNSDNGAATYVQTILAYLGEAGQGIIDVETK